MRDARLLETDLRDADFTEADLREADAGGTVSRHAGLCPADVRGAGLTEADLLEVRLNGAVADEHWLAGPSGHAAAGVVVTEDGDRNRRRTATAATAPVRGDGDPASACAVPAVTQASGSRRVHPVVLVLRALLRWAGVTAARGVSCSSGSRHSIM
ncbi:pentapeptide repeat-containing protein [Streptomyces rochei]|uniref:pentapeptide repeat-containing protein n=2 Tax=Streptomyces rochei TaxID=1928 RepID=UPI0033BE463C